MVIPKLILFSPVAVRIKEVFGVRRKRTASCMYFVIFIILKSMSYLRIFDIRKAHPI